MKKEYVVLSRLKKYTTNTAILDIEANISNKKGNTVKNMVLTNKLSLSNK